MNKQILELIKSSCTVDNDFKSLENIFDLYDQLQYCSNLREIAENLFDWLNEKYGVDDMNFYLFNMEENTSTPVLKKGEEFYLDGEFSSYFIINTHTEINAVVSFASSSQEIFEKVQMDYSHIEAAFFLISPIL